MRVGSGRKGYYNVLGSDPRVHSQSARGMKQPQRLPIGAMVTSRSTQAKGQVVSNNPFTVKYDIDDKKAVRLSNPKFWEKGGKCGKLQFPVCDECGHRHYKRAGLKCEFKGNTLKDFEQMRNMAELRAWSHLSLQRPLSHKEYKRIMQLKKKCLGGKIYFSTKGFEKPIYTLPIENAIYVPSTKDKHTKITKKEFNKRIKETQDFLRDLYGGFTSVQTFGGYTDEGEKIEEKGVKVVSFALKKDMKNKLKNQELKKFLGNKQEEWSQDSIGYENQGKLYYLKKKVNE